MDPDMPELAPCDGGCAVCDELAEAVYLRDDEFILDNLDEPENLRMCWRWSLVFIDHLLRSSPVSLANTSLNPLIPKYFTFRSTGKECSWKTRVKGRERYNFYVPDKLAQELRKNRADSNLFILHDDDF